MDNNFNKDLVSRILQIQMQRQDRQPFEKYKQERKYISLMEKVGSWNRYQFYLFFLLSAISILQAIFIFIPPYLFHTAKYQCDSTTSEECTMFVCSLPPAQRASYISYSPFRSLADDLGVDFRCQYSSMSTLISTLVYFSIITGMLLFSSFTQRLGRKNSLVLSSNLILIGLVIILLSGFYQSIPMALTSIVILYWGCKNTYQYIFCLAAEVVAEQYRVLYMNLLNVSYGIGVMVNAIAFYYFKQWTKVYILVIGVPIIIVILGVIFFLEKTPIDLLSTECQENILTNLKRIAQFNKLQFTVTLGQIRDLKRDYAEAVQDDSFTIIQLFKFPSLRTIIYPLAFINFSTNYLFIAPSVIGSGITSDLFDQGIVSGLSFIVSIIILYLLLERRNRRQILFVMNMLALVFAIALRMGSNSSESTLYLIIYFVFRLLASISTNCVYIIDYEIFPTQIRVVGANIMSISGALAGIVQPSIVSLLQSHEINIVNQFVLIVLVSFIPIVYLKQTFKVAPPEIIEQIAQRQSKQSKR